jgi:hypothetical protein
MTSMVTGIAVRRVRLLTTIVLYTDWLKCRVVSRESLAGMFACPSTCIIRGYHLAHVITLTFNLNKVRTINVSTYCVSKYLQKQRKTSKASASVRSINEECRN